MLWTVLGTTIVLLLLLLLLLGPDMFIVMAINSHVMTLLLLTLVMMT